MIKSTFIYNILSLLIEGHECETYLQKQLDFLIDSDYSYTGSGLIVTFTHDKAINNSKVNSDYVLNGVKITSTELELGAQTNLFFNEGIMSYLEIFSNSSFYPEKFLSNYELSQEWLPNGGKKILFP